MTAETSLAAFIEEQPLIQSQIERLKDIFRHYRFYIVVCEKATAFRRVDESQPTTFI